MSSVEGSTEERLVPLFSPPLLLLMLSEKNPAAFFRLQVTLQLVPFFSAIFQLLLLGNLCGPGDQVAQWQPKNCVFVCGSGVCGRKQ